LKIAFNHILYLMNDRVCSSGSVCVRFAFIYSYYFT
jgi:hypothetical protein